MDPGDHSSVGGTVPAKPGARRRGAGDEGPETEVYDAGGDATLIETALRTTRDRSRDAARTDDPGTLARTRRMLAVGLALIPLYLVLDYFIATYVEPTAPWKLLAVHGGQFTHIGLTLVAISVWTPAPRQLLRLERFTTISTSAISAGACVVAGGVASVYGLSITVILMCRLAMRSDRVRDAWPSVIGSVLSYPAVILAGAALSPRLAEQLGDPHQVATMGVYLGFDLLVAVFVLAGGQAAWQLRRQLVEARQIGRYRLRRRLGAGGMGEVWAAYYPALKREVAVKILRPNSGGEHAIARFEREVHATAMLSHPNTVRVFDHGVTPDGMWYYAMELLEGETLRDLVRSEGPLEPRRAARLVHQASRAMAEAHSRGVIHRDVKPENLFITTAGIEPDFVKVLDFGIARLRAPSPGPALTATGDFAGTPLYSAPEVIDGEAADERADVYGLGACLYYALSGDAPFPGKGVAQVVAAIAGKPLRPPSARRGEPLPPGLEAIALQALARDRERRYADAAALAAALGDWLRAAR